MLALWPRQWLTQKLPKDISNEIPPVSNANLYKQAGIAG